MRTADGVEEPPVLPIFRAGDRPVLCDGKLIAGWA